MSVVIEFRQIEKKNIISENKICEIFELKLEDVNWKGGCHLDPDLFYELISPTQHWTEVYFRPPLARFLFYFLAIDLESNIGVKNVNEETILLAHSPTKILEFIGMAKEYTKIGRNGKFDELKELLEEAVQKEYLIVTKYN
ncbi:MAG: hypothetical protein H6571_09135 [Lewinellaceae bacterium]|nr:hypothetical protein [Bacteroidota bacterium]MCB9323884.1 hypothetical protein [Lewinellaceae bacterium]